MPGSSLAEYMRQLCGKYVSVRADRSRSWTDERLDAVTGQFDRAPTREAASRSGIVEVASNSSELLLRSTGGIWQYRIKAEDVVSIEVVSEGAECF